MDNLTKVFEALGEKIAHLELELSCKKFLLEKAEKENEELRKKIADFMGIAEAPADEEW